MTIDNMPEKECGLIVTTNDNNEYGVTFIPNNKRMTVSCGRFKEDEVRPFYILVKDIIKFRYTKP